MRVNNCELEQLNQDYANSLFDCKKRNLYQWDLDLSIITDSGYELNKTVKKEDRSKIAEGLAKDYRSDYSFEVAEYLRACLKRTPNMSFMLFRNLSIGYENANNCNSAYYDPEPKIPFYYRYKKGDIVSIDNSIYEILSIIKENSKIIKLKFIRAIDEDRYHNRFNINIPIDQFKKIKHHR